VKAASPFTSSVTLLTSSFTLLTSSFLLAPAAFGQPRVAPTLVQVSPVVVAPLSRGARGVLEVDLVPQARIHVYAPGAKGYTAVVLDIPRTKGLTIGKAAYPKSELLLSAGEIVPAYQAPFRLSRAVTVDPKTKPGSVLTVTGSVTYQACDDRVCYDRVVAPVSWTVRVK